MRKETEDKCPEASGAHPRDELENYFPDPSSTIIFIKNSIGRCIANNTSYNLQSSAGFLITYSPSGKKNE